MTYLIPRSRYIIDGQPSNGDDICDTKFDLVPNVSKNDEFCIKNEELCIKNEELCIKNEELCIKNDEFCRLTPL